MSINALKSSGSSMKNIQFAIDAVAQNIANVNTTAYKENKVNFESVVNNLSEIARYSGTAIASVNANFTQGKLKSTGQYTDLGIQGKGFFTVQSSNGDIVFTRDGNFKIDGESTLVTANGDFVLSAGGGKIIIPTEATSVEINAGGEIKYLPQGSDQYQLLTQLQVANFVNPQSLEALGNNQFRESLNSGVPEFSTALGTGTSTAETVIVSGTLETSNADLSTNMVDLIAYQRSYQSVSKAVSTANELLETTLALKR